MNSHRQLILANKRSTFSSLAVALCAFVAAGSATLAADEPKPKQDDFPGNEFVRARFVLEKTAVAPRGVTHLAVVFDISPGWHVYWRNPGDSGLPPRVKFATVSGVTFGTPEWPAPQRRVEAGSMVDYTFEHELVLIVPMTLSDAASIGANLKISADVDWLVCKERCVPGRAAVSATWPVSADAKPSADAALFAKARARHAQPATAASKSCEISWDGFDLLIHAKGATRLVFFPYENDENVFPDDIVQSGESKSDSLRLHYPADATKLKRIAGVICITKGGSEMFQEFEISAPAKDAIAKPKK